MPHIVEDRILETTASIGVGDIALAAAVTGFRRFGAVCAIGDTVPYFIEAVDSVGMPTGDYEYGIGTYSAANTLTRTTVRGSSNGGAAVNFAAGSKNVGMPALAGSMVPTGAVFHMAGNAAPAGYLELAGQLISRVQYPALWAYAQGSGNIAANDGAWSGAQFSPGDGATTFRLPDARGEFIRGWDHGRGVDAGRTIGSAQTDSIKDHTHTLVFADNTANGFSNVPYSNNTGIGSGATSGVRAPNAGGVETRPRNVAMLACIKT